MRLHHLTMTAFGPYAGTEAIDFDELNDAGVFLLTGPTGAGKTSILDAICFALYGVVPGDRGVKTLRSHHAAADVRPEVVLEATLGDRRYRVRRSPEWLRPKRRGAGVTREQARAALLEVTDGVERLVSSRAAEVGHTLTGLLGMGSEQFMQVVLLPQGEFQRFLRASSDDRQAVLQKLFRTQRFARIEDWVRDHSKSLAEDAAGGERRVTQLLATLADRAGAPPPEPVAAALAEARVGAVTTEALGWAAGLARVAAETHEAAAAADRTAQDQLAAAEARRAHAERLAQLRDRRTRARAALEGLGEDAAAESLARDRLATHRQAATIGPLLDQLRRIRDRRDVAEAAWQAALSGVDRLEEDLRPATGDLAGCRDLEARLADRVASLRAVLRREELLERLQAEAAAGRGRLEELEARLQDDRERAAALPVEVQQAAADLSAAREAAARLEEARGAATEAKRRQESAVALATAGRRHAELLEKAHTARELAADARERHLAILERRLAGMAAELAGQLTPGVPCVVCGAVQHPQPAVATAEQVDPDAQRAAQQEAEQRRAEHERVAGEVDRSAQRLAALTVSAGGLTPEEAAGRLREARALVTRTERTAAAEAAHAARHESLTAEERRLSTRLQEGGSLREELRGQLRTLEAQLADGLAEVRAVVGAADLTAREALSCHEEAVWTVAAAVQTGTAAATAALHLTEAQEAADRAAREHGFPSAAESLAGRLPEEEAATLRAWLEGRDEQRHAAQATLADPDVLALPDGPAPDLSGFLLASAEARQRSRTATSAAATAAAALADLTRLGSALEEAVKSWEPARLRHATADGIARLVRGTGTENQLQMRLSSYVLATRLDQVVDAANERLAHLRDPRYRLRRTAEARGGSRAGLGLELLDDWTGVVRSPTTLSGGETFVVSLALALGLADVVAQESGGLRVETLFVDEGFGMLDPDTLDDVMDRIDALRAGGRTVGVVSHVTELRGRIPTQVHVTRERDGSRVSVRTLVP